MPPTLTVVFRFLWYIFSRILIWAIAAALVVLSFFAAMDYMNAKVLTKDGLQLRADVIIKGDDPTALSKVFSKNFLEQDTQLSSSVYRSYAVTDIDYNADIGFRLILPWQSSIVLRVTEKVSRIDGTLVGGSDDTLSETPPQWKNAVYNVKLVRYEGNWRIVSMDLIEELPMPTPSPSPTPSKTPKPTATPAPSADQTESAQPASEVIED